MITICFTGLICSIGILLSYKVPSAFVKAPSVQLTGIRNITIYRFSNPATKNLQINSQNIPKLLSQEMGFIFYIRRKINKGMIPRWGTIQINLHPDSSLENVNTSI
jgi:hypothetical protein